MMDAVVEPVRREAMRIAGMPVRTDEMLEVRNPYSGALVGTVPAARPEHVRRAFAAAKGFRPALSRYQRQRILLDTAAALASRKDAIARLI
ncbi:MAG: aldehyde dehydrogenase family protein, partial [Acetobacteraceae bacterium]